MKEITIQHSMAVEFMTALIRCATKEKFQSYIRENGYLHSETIRKYLQEINDGMSIFLKNDMEILIKEFRTNFYYPVMLIAEHNIESVEEFIRFFKGIDSKAYLEKCFELCPADVTMMCDDTEILEKITETNSKNEAELFVEFKRNPEEMKKRLDNLFQVFYLSFFKKYESNIEKAISKKVETHKKRFNKDPNGFLKVIGNGDYSKALEDNYDFKIYICYLEEFTVRYMFYNNNHMFIYGFSEEQKLERKKLDNKSQEIFKILSDETRLDILRLLGQQKWYRSHLVKHLGLTSATMTYHLNKLVTLGIITLEINQENKNTQYILNEERLKQLVDRAVGDILQK